MDVIPGTYDTTGVSQTQLSSAMSDMQQHPEIIPPTYPETFSMNTIPSSMPVQATFNSMLSPSSNVLQAPGKSLSSSYRASCQPLVVYSQSIIRRQDDVPAPISYRPANIVSSLLYDGDEAMVNYKTFRKTVHPYQMRERVTIKWDPESYNVPASAGAKKQAHIWSLRMPKTPRNSAANLDVTGNSGSAVPSSDSVGVAGSKKRMLPNNGTPTISEAVISSLDGLTPDSKRVRYENTIPATNYDTTIPATNYA